MILREFFYFDKQTFEPVEDKSYDAVDDESIVKRDDTRKTRLTLKQINKARKASEFHQEEKEGIVESLVPWTVVQPSQPGQPAKPWQEFLTFP